MGVRKIYPISGPSDAWHRYISARTEGGMVNIFRTLWKQSILVLLLVTTWASTSSTSLTPRNYCCQIRDDVTRHYFHFELKASLNRTRKTISQTSCGEYLWGLHETVMSSIRQDPSAEFVWSGTSWPSVWRSDHVSSQWDRYVHEDYSNATLWRSSCTSDFFLASVRAIQGISGDVNTDKPPMSYKDVMSRPDAASGTSIWTAFYGRISRLILHGVKRRGPISRLGLKLGKQSLGLTCLPFQGVSFRLKQLLLHETS